MIVEAVPDFVKENMIQSVFLESVLVPAKPPLTVHLSPVGAELQPLLREHDTLVKMSRASRAVGRPEAARNIGQERIRGQSYAVDLAIQKF